MKQHSTYPRQKTNILVYVCVAVVAFLLVSDKVSAGNAYVPLEALPGVSNTSNQDLAGYLNAVYLVLIGVGSLLAVVKIVLAGVQYAMSDVITTKESAKKSIYGALIGLAILLVPYIVLSTIYPGLISFNILQNSVPVEVLPIGGGSAQQQAQVPPTFTPQNTPVGTTLTPVQLNTLTPTEITQFGTVCSSQNGRVVPSATDSTSRTCARIVAPPPDEWDAQIDAKVSDGVLTPVDAVVEKGVLVDLQKATVDGLITPELMQSTGITDTGELIFAEQQGKSGVDQAILKKTCETTWDGTFQPGTTNPQGVSTCTKSTSGNIFSDPLGA